MDGAGFARLRRGPGNRAVERPVELQRRRARSGSGAARGRTARATRRRRASASAPGIVSAITSGAASRSPPASSTPTTRPRSTATRVTVAPVRTAPPSSRRYESERVREPAGAALGAGPAGAVAEQVQVGGGDRAAPPGRAARRSASPTRTATRASPRPRTASRRATAAAIGSSRAKPSIPRGPSPAVRRSGARTGGKPPSIVSRSASKCVHERRRERAPALAVAGVDRVEARGGAIEVAIQRHGACRRAAGGPGRRGGWIQRRPWRSSGMRGEHGRGRAGRIDRGEGVVVKPRERELLGRDGATGARRGLQHEHAPSRPREGDGRRQPVGARPDDQRVVAHSASIGRHAPTSWP